MGSKIIELGDSAVLYVHFYNHVDVAQLMNIRVFYHLCGFPSAGHYSLLVTFMELRMLLTSI